MAIRDNLEARGLRQAQSNPRRSVADLDVLFRQKRKPHIHVSSAIVDFDLAASVLQSDVVLCAHAEVPRSVKDFKAARSGLHMTGELRKCQIGAPRNESHALRHFVGADRAVKFAVDSKTAGCTRYVDVPAVARNLDVAIGIGNFDITFLRVDIDVSSRPANLYIAGAIRHADRPPHLGNRDVAFLIPDRQRSLLRHRHVKIQADARVASAGFSRPDFVAVAILHDFNANPISKLLSFALIPGLGILLAHNPNLRIVRRAYADVAAAVAYRNARVHGNGLGGDVQVKGKTVSPLPNVAGEIFPEVIDGNHDSEKTEKSDYKKNFASCNLRRARIASAARLHPFLQFNPAPQNQNERPRVPDHLRNTDILVVVKEQQHSNK